MLVAGPAFVCGQCKKVECMQALIEFLQATLVVPLALLPIINPVGGAAIFSSVIGGSEKLARPMARQVALNVWIILMAAMLIGSYLLDLFGISLPIVRVGGGLLVAATGWRMLNSEGDNAVHEAIALESGDLSAEEIARRSFFPLSFPLTSGPGSIATSIALGTRIPTTPANYVLGVVVAVIGTALTAAIVFLCYRYAVRLQQRMGAIGVIVIGRMSAFILLCIGIEMIWAGWLGLRLTLTAG